MTKAKTKATPEVQDTPKLYRLSDDELRKFVLDYIANDIFTHFQLGDQAEQMMGMVFMPLSFGALADWTKEEVADIGCIYARISEGTFPRSINGFPIFGSCAFMHKDDWNRARAAILKAQAALESLDV